MSHIVIVDDDQMTLSLLDSILTSMDCQVSVAHSGEQFLTLAKKLSLGTIEAVILDMMMPGLDGLETLTQFRKISGGSSVPVIMLTGKDDPATIKSAYNLGIRCYLSKPFSKQQLFHALELARSSEQ
jgi:DNA-binding response OmpR family regulator